MIHISQDITNNSFIAKLPPDLFQHLPDNIFSVIVERVCQQFMEKHGEEVLNSIPLETVREVVSGRLGEKISDSVVELVSNRLKL